jgi:hypothetical protein
MAEFYAWAITGVISEYETWSGTGNRRNARSSANHALNARPAPQIAQQHKFILRDNNGRATEVHFANSKITFRNGHKATVVWAAREGSSHGLCVQIDNHTTDTTTRLRDNMALIQPKAALSTIAGYGLLATIPIALALLTWLFIPGNVDGISGNLRLIAVALAITAMFGMATLISNFIWTYMHREDEEKIKRVVRNAIRGNWTAPLPANAPPVKSTSST